MAEVRSHLEKERDFRASLYKMYRRGTNVVDGVDTALSVASAALAATGVGLLSTIIAAPVAIGLQAGAIACGLLGASGKLIGRRLHAKARKHNQIRVLAVSKLNTIADRISTALTDDKISEKEFRLILSELDKYEQLKAGSSWASETGRGSARGRKKAAHEVNEKRGDANSPYQAAGRAPLDRDLASLKTKRAQAGPTRL